MKTPEYWQSNSLLSKLLQPFGILYGALTQLRLKLKKPRSASVPVICIGNITAGGTGKTPVAISIAKLLTTEMYHPFFLTRGYGGKLQNVLVNNRKHSPKDVGDEPLLLAQQAPVAVNADRFAGAELAVANGADILLMDDGFQNPSLHKDLSFLVFDGSYGTGNGKIIPAGPLRETFADGIKRADALIILGKDKHHLKEKSSLPVFFAHTEAVQTLTGNLNVLAFAGIGHPQKFYRTLTKQGFNIVETVDFPDHHFYTASELERLLEKARKLNAEVYTTSKDYVKIPSAMKKEIKVLDITVVWDEPEKLLHFIKEKTAPLIDKNSVL